MTWNPTQRIFRDHSLAYAAEPWSYVGHLESETLIYYSEFELEGKRIKFRSGTRPSLGGGFTIDENSSADGDPSKNLSTE